jgi:hypothetical protein
MPAKVCANCKQKKPGIKLNADDLLCPECYADNERKLAAAKGGPTDCRTEGQGQRESSSTSKDSQTEDQKSTIPNRRKKTVIASKQSEQTTQSVAQKTANDDDAIASEDIQRQQPNPKHPSLESHKQQSDTVKKTREAFTFSDESDDESTCSVCLLPISNKDRANNACLKCEICNESFHSKCVHIPCDTGEQWAQLLANIGWVCGDCKRLARGQYARFQTMLSSLAEELASLQKQFQNFTRNTIQQSTPQTNIIHGVAANESKGDFTCKQQIQQQQQSQSDKSTQQQVCGSDDFDAAVGKAIQDITRRKQNVIISGVPEDPSVSDRDTILQICSTYLPVKPLVSEKDCTRIGKPVTGKPRRLLVRLRSENVARELLQSAPLLRLAADKAVAGAVFINPDLSPAESKRAYEMRKTRREKRQQGSKNVSEPGNDNRANDVGVIDDSQKEPNQPIGGNINTANISPFRL